MPGFFFRDRGWPGADMVLNLHVELFWRKRYERLLNITFGNPMPSPVNLSNTSSSHSLETSGSQATAGQNKRSAPSGRAVSGSGLIPDYSVEILQAAPSLNLNNIDPVSGRPAKMPRRGAISTFSQINAQDLQPSQSGLDRAADETADLLASTNLKDQVKNTKNFN